MKPENFLLFLGVVFVVWLCTVAFIYIDHILTRLRALEKAAGVEPPPLLNFKVYNDKGKFE